MVEKSTWWGVVAGLSLGVLAALSPSCGNSGGGACSATSCPEGCCDEKGVCRGGISEDACGPRAGGACAVCSATERCDNRACSPRIGGTGGGTGASGGGASSTGGGTGASGGGSSSSGGGMGGGMGDGGQSCAQLPHDAVLGRLVLGAGVSVLGSAALPAGIETLATTPGADGGPGELWALMTSARLEKLGSFPNLALGDAGLSVKAAADQDAGVYPSHFLVSTDTRLFAGYTRAGSGFPGQVAEYDFFYDTLKHTSVPGNYSAAASSFGVLVNALGAGGVDGGVGVYGLGTTPPTRVASFDPAASPSSGTMASTVSGAVLAGYFNGNDFTNNLRALSPAQVKAAFQQSTVQSLVGAPLVYSGEDLFEAVGVGDTVVLHRGMFDSTTFLPKTAEVSGVPVTVTDAGVSVGAQLTLLTSDGCTNVQFLAAHGAALLVGVEDRNGRRLLRLKLP